MKTSKLPWSSPYKTRLWLFRYNSDTFCKKELELWDHIASFGKKGCGNTNLEFAAEIHRSRATVKRYLHNLESNCLIVKRPGWAKLSGGKFVQTLRYRLIFALPWPNRRTWLRERYFNDRRISGSKMSHFQQRRSKTPTWQVRKRLLSSAQEKGTPRSAREGSSEMGD